MKHIENAHVERMASHARGLSHESITRPAFARLVALLEARGNRLSKDHKAALLALVETMTEMAVGKRTGRWAFGLPTGTGKTTAIAAWCATLVATGVDDIGVSIAASKVEALCELKRDLLAQGVPEDRIGLVHSKRFDPGKREGVRRGDPAFDAYASEPSEGHDRQILLVTHQRVRGCSLDGYGTYRGRPRDLMLYDESLLVSDSYGVPVNRLRAGISWFQVMHGHEEQYAPLIGFLEETDRLISQALSKGGGGGLITLPPTTPETLESYRRLLDGHEAVAPLYELLEIATQELRVIGQGQGAVVSYQISVPPELGNILVLDASQPIRRLVHLDKTIKDAEEHLPQVHQVGCPLSNIKRFDDVTIHQMFSGGGRSTMNTSFTLDREEGRGVSLAVVDVIREQVPDDEAVLVFVYKTRQGDNAKRGKRGPVDYRAILLSDLQEAGIDVEAMVETPSGPRRRINVATWGSETSTNAYDHCSHVILAGVLQRSPVDLAACYLGQTDNLEGDVQDREVSDLQASEVSHLVYQALSRGRCRKVDNGRALPMTAWIIHRDKGLQKDLEKVMPGVNWEVWESDRLPKTKTSIGALSKRITDQLDCLSQSTDRVSTRVLKQELDACSIPNTTWRLALKSALEDNPEWVLEGRSVVRVVAHFGLTPE